MLTILFVLLTICFGVCYLKSRLEYWERRRVPGPRARTVIASLWWRGLLRKRAPFEVFTELYNEYGNECLVGIYKTATPALIIRDPDLIKEVSVRRFDHFHDNALYVHKEVDPLFGRNPFVLRGQEWRVVRGQLTPGFSSGKMKWMYPLLEEVGNKLVNFLTHQAFNECYEARELSLKFTLNNVASCAFGLEARCFEQERSEFRQIADQFLTPDGLNALKIVLVTVFPPASHWLSVKFTPHEVEERLLNLVRQTLRYREENGLIRTDFLHILSQLKSTCKEYAFTDVDVAAHVAGFFADGYETSSVVMTLLIYQLSANPQVQAKLRHEVELRFEEHGDRLPYDALQEMPYLDAVINELLRMHPPAHVLHKVCTKQCTLDTATNGSVLVEEGTPIILPIHGLHNDPRYFQQPHLFRPERFLDGEVDRRAFMPFGEGPRSCLGRRFALLQIKVGICYIIRHFDLVVNRRTKVPLEFDSVYFLVTPRNEIWIDFRKIV